MICDLPQANPGPFIDAIRLHCKPGPLPKTSEWDRARLYDPTAEYPVRIGASESAAACGVSRYDQPLSLYLQKRGELSKDFSESATTLTRFGLLMEPVILTEYQHRKATECGQCFVFPGQPVYFSLEWPWMSATPDALATDGKSEWVVECKNTSEHMHDRKGDSDVKFGVDGTDQVPIEYIFQAQHQMAVLGLSLVEFPVLVGGNRLNIYRVNRDEDLISTIVQATRDLAEQIIAGKPPEPVYTAPDIKRCLRSGIVDGKTVELPEEAADWWQKYRDASDSIKAAEKIKDESMARLLGAVGDAEFGIVGGIKLKRIVIGPSSYTKTVNNPGYSYLRASK